MCAGRAEIPEILQNFRAIQLLRKICIISTLDSRIIFVLSARRLGKELHLSFAVRATTLAEFTKLLCARRAEFFSEILQFFRASWARNLRDPDAGRLLSSDLNAILTLSTLSDIVQYAQRTMAECTQFLCAGRAEFPEIL